MAARIWPLRPRRKRGREGEANLQSPDMTRRRRLLCPCPLLSLDHWRRGGRRSPLASKVLYCTVYCLLFTAVGTVTCCIERRGLGWDETPKALWYMCGRGRGKRVLRFPRNGEKQGESCFFQPEKRTNLRNTLKDICRWQWKIESSMQHISSERSES